MRLLFWMMLTLLCLNVNGWRRRRRRRRPPPPPSCQPQNCIDRGWGGWSGCSQPCGTGGTQQSHRIISEASCRGTCHLVRVKTRPCNRDPCTACHPITRHCYPSGTLHSGGCSCSSGYTGQCCNQDVNECNSNPCQHICKNRFGTGYGCDCHLCYTKRGTRCDLLQCIIGGQCYSYRTANPTNVCQYCHEARKTSWSINPNVHQCNDGNACTRNDRCVSGTCIGTPFSCLWCQTCNGDTCVLNPGHCLINGTCYTERTVRPGRPCQECDSNNPSRWTTNNNLKCSDNNLKTKNDRCVKGLCLGIPYICLSCQSHNGAGGCIPKDGFCVIQQKSLKTCFRHGQAKPGNPCQVCDTSSNKVAWTNLRGVPCDDGDMCTCGDTCSAGQCKSTHFSCTSPCQFCNGNNCSLNKGFGFKNGSCTCKIDGSDYGHQSANPSNPCLLCDLMDASTRARGTWSHLPSVPCNDNNHCTKRDRCNQGRCEGEPYSCNSLRFPPSSCISTSVCNGDGTCRLVMKSRDTICRAATDVCDTAERCNGKLASCPSAVTDTIRISNGSVQIRDEAFVQELTYQHNLDRIHIFVSGYFPSCGAVTYNWYLLDASSGCSVSSSTKGILTGSGPWYTLRKLPVVDNSIYRISIQAISVRNTSHPPICSGAVTIDTSTPQGGWVRDGLGADVDFQKTKLVQANWGGMQTRNGVDKYEWKALYTEEQSNTSRELFPYRNVGLNIRVHRVFELIRDGGKIVIKVRAYTKAGLFSELRSDGVVIDTSPPKAGLVRDGSSLVLGLKYAKWDNIFSANWDRFTDQHSNISHYAWAIQRKGFGLVTLYKFIRLKRSQRWIGLNLVSGESYCAIVKGFNQAGLSTRATSNCVIIDRDVPQAGKVYDGMNDDIHLQSENTSLSANWEGFSDGERGSGIIEYKYRVTDRHDNILVDWSAVGNGKAANVTITGLSLINGMQYFMSIRAVDAVGLVTDVKSDGVVVDASHPAFNGRVVITGENDVKNGSPCVYVPSTTSVTVHWSGFTDVHTGIQRYEYAVLLANKKPVLSNFTRLNGLQTVTSYNIKNIKLQEGKQYRVTIRSYNNAGLYTDARSSIVIPDESPPHPGEVLDSPNHSSDANYVTELNSISASWKGFVDPDTEIKQYFVAVGSCSQGNYHVTENDFITVDPSTATSTIVFNISLVNGHKYCVKVKAKNKAGLFSPDVASDGFIVDATPPNAREAEVRDGLEAIDIDYQSNTTDLSANWEGFMDLESGIKYYETGVSRTQAGTPDVAPLLNISRRTSMSFTKLQLNEGVYYIIVCAVNFAELRKCISSDGVLVDLTPPSKGVVHDGILEPDMKYQSNNNSIAANWEGIRDIQSGIEKFEWAIGTSISNKTSIQRYTDVGLSTHVRANIGLMHGQKYYISLRVTNQAGTIRELMSDGVIVDCTPPVPSTIYPGHITQGEWIYNQDQATYYSSIATGLAAHWDDFVEVESEIWYYEWSIGTSRCGTQVQPFLNIGRVTSVNGENSVVLNQGKPYYITVLARNRAGLVAQLCSHPFVFDNSPPNAGQVTVGPTLSEPRKYVTEENVLVHLSDFADLESGITYCHVTVWSKGSVILHNTTIINTNTSNFLALSGAFFKERLEYTATATCFNGAGLSSNASSSTFVIVKKPPLPINEIVIGVLHNDTLNFQADTKTLTASWAEFNQTYSPVVSYSVALGTKALQEDIVRFLGIGLKTEWEFTGLKLHHGSIYYVTVLAFNAVRRNASLSSKGLLIDTTPPLINSRMIKDGVKGGHDVDFFSSSTDIGGNWESTDRESGIVQNDICVGTTAYGCQIHEFINVGKSTSFLCKHCRIEPGEKVYFTVRVSNGAGLSSTASSNGMLFDTSGPTVGNVNNRNGPVVQDQLNMSVSWFGAEDLESGIKECSWIVEGENGIGYYRQTLNGSSILGKKITIESSLKYANLSKVTNTKFFNVILCTNKVGIGASSKSDGFKIFHSRYPEPGNVRSGIARGTHSKYSKNTQIVGGNWDLFQADDVDPVDQYAWAVGTSPGQEDILRFTDVGITTIASQRLVEDKSDVDILTSGNNFFITVKASTASGLISTQSSEKFTVDNSPPTETELKVSHTIVNQFPPVVDLKLSWSDIKDSESGIRSTFYCIGKVEGDCETDTINAENRTYGVFSELPLKEQDVFFANVFVKNGAGLTLIMTKTIAIDVTPPLAGVLNDWSANDAGFSHSSSVIAVEYSGFKDEESNITKCTWALLQVSANRSNERMVFKQRVHASEGQAKRTGLSLLPGFYRNRITCENKDGFEVSSTSQGVTVDITPPLVGRVNDGDLPVLDMDYQSSLSSVQATWQGFQDHDSGIKEYNMAIGTATAYDNVMPLQNVGKRSTWKAENLTLMTGTVYYVTIEAVNSAGLKVLGASDGFMVDDTAPNISIISSSSRLIGPNDTLQATWLVEDEESGISRTEYCIGTTSSGCQLKHMTALPPNTTNIVCEDCSLKHGLTYFVIIRVWNRVNLFSLATTTGTTVDKTPPSAGRIINNIMNTSCTKMCTLFATITEFGDNESGLNSCRFSVKNDTAYIAPFVNFNLSSRAKVVGVNLKSGQRYYSVVECTNMVGLKSTTINGNGIVVDNTPPSQGTVIVSPDRTHDVYGLHSSCHLLNQTLRVHWSNFTDKESGIEGFRVAIGRKPYMEDVRQFIDVGLTTETHLHVSASPDVFSGDVIYITVQCRNGVGLTSTSVSPPTKLVDVNKEMIQEGNFHCINLD